MEKWPRYHLCPICGIDGSYSNCRDRQCLDDPLEISGHDLLDGCRLVNTQEEPRYRKSRASLERLHESLPAAVSLASRLSPPVMPRISTASSPAVALPPVQ